MNQDIRRGAARLLGGAVLLLAAGCHRPADEGVLRQAGALCQRGQWDAAVPFLKQYLLDYPRHTAAHFYLGRCYLNGQKRFLGAAEGELLAALDLFHQDHRHSPIPEFSDEYFELRCHLELGKVHLRALMHAVSGGVPAIVIHELAGKCRSTAENARRLAPDSEDVKELEQIVDGILHMHVHPQSAPAPRQPFQT